MSAAGDVRVVASPSASVDRVRVEAEALAKAYVKGGGKAVGYVTASAPVEMIAAAGMLPVELSAGDVTATPKADHVMEDLFHPSVRGILERAMRGDFAHLSGMVAPRTSDAPHRLYYYLCEFEREGGTVPKPLLFDVTQTSGLASERYTAGRLAHLWEQLRAIGNGSAGDKELRAAIAASNRRRVLLNRMIERRREGRVTGAEALAAFAASRMLPPDVFETRMTAWLDVPAAEAKRGPRVVIAGSVQDDAGLHELVEAAGGVVVGDFHGAGELSVGGMIAETGDPMAALAAHYRGDVSGARSFDDQEQAVVAFAKAARADGLMFSYLPVEEALTWDYPAQAVGLKRAGVACVRLGDQARPYDVAARRAEAAAFVQTLKEGGR